MKRDDFADRQRELAALDRQMAELLVRRAAILDELAEGEANPRTGRRAQRPHRPSFAPVSSLDQARCDEALRQLERKRSLAR